MRLKHIICICLFLCFLFPISACGANFPFLFGPMVYTGKFTYEDMAYNVLLVLGEDQKFLLKEDVLLPNGKRSEWETVGKWHQIREKAFLQLSNQEGFQRLFNVGGTGNLYLSMQLPMGLMVTTTLRSQPWEKYIKEISRVALVDKTTQQTPPKYVLRAVAGSRWKVTRLSGALVPHHTPYMVSFPDNVNNHSGRIEVFDGITHVVGSYTLQKSGLSFSVATKDSGFTKLMQETTSWDLTGDVLELWGKDKMLAVLEKMY